MKESKPMVGLIPMGKFVFSNEDAIRYKKLVQAKLTTWGVRYVDLEGVLEDGLVKDQKHVDPVVKHMKEAGVDCIFMPHCNFGTEGAVGMIAKKMGVPLLLWGPRDEAPLPDGSRLRDSLCGLFASSKIVYKLNVPFTYIENCRIDDAPFQKGVDTFLRAVSIADLFRKGVRIGRVGDRIDFFWTTIINESELLERFNVEVVPFDAVEFIRAAKNRAKSDRVKYEREVKELRQKHTVNGLDGNDEPLINVLAVADQLMALGEDHGLAAFAFRDYYSIIDEMGVCCCHAKSLVGEHYAIGTEVDIHGAISDLILRRATFNTAPAYLAEFTVRHPENDNAAMLWHDGAPLSMCHPDDHLVLGRHWVQASTLPGMNHFRLKDGPLTVARFDGERGQYKLGFGEGKTVDGPKTQNNYAWMEVDNWPRWERTLMEGPYIHHLAMTYGHYGDALQEACKYIPGLEPERLG